MLYLIGIWRYFFLAIDEWLIIRCMLVEHELLSMIFFGECRRQPAASSHTHFFLLIIRVCGFLFFLCFVLFHYSIHCHVKRIDVNLFSAAAASDSATVAGECDIIL